MTSQINFDNTRISLEIRIGVIKAQIERLYNNNPKLAQNIIQSYEEFSQIYIEMTEQQKQINILNYLITKLESGEIDQADDNSQEIAKIVAEQKARNRQKEIIDNSGIRNFEVGKVEIDNLGKLKNEVVKLVFFDLNKELDKQKCDTAMQVLNNYWQLVEFGNNKIAFGKLAAIINEILFETDKNGQKVSKSKTEKQNSAFEMLKTEQDLNENSTLTQRNQVKNNVLIDLEAKLMIWQEYKNSLEKNITEDFGDQVLRELGVKKNKMDKEIKLLTNQKEILEREILQNKRQELEELLNLQNTANLHSSTNPQALVPIAKNEIVNSKEIPKSWEELGKRFDKIPDKYFTKFGSKKDELEIWKTERTSFCVGLNRLTYFCAFPCSKLRFSPRYEPNRGSIKSFDERGLCKITHDPEYKYVEFEDLSAAYLELRDFFVKFGLEF